MTYFSQFGISLGHRWRLFSHWYRPRWHTTHYTEQQYAIRLNWSFLSLTPTSQQPK